MVSACCSMCMLDEHLPALGPKGRSLLRIGKAFLDMIGVWRSHERIIPLRDRQRVLDLYMSVVRLWPDAGMAFKPKMHIIGHLIYASWFTGNPDWFATWKDEGQNKVLADVARSAHSSLFEIRVLVNLEAEAELKKRKRQRYG